MRKLFPGPAGALVALAGLDLDLAAGEFVCLVGPSGCGKSTFLRILGGLEAQTSGTVDFGPAPPSSAFVFQEFGIFPWLNVLDNVGFGLRMAGLGREERERIARHWIQRVNLSGFERAYPAQLSGGMKQRVSIARAFASDPDLFLMDEPLGALDAQTRYLLQEELIGLWEASRKTVLLVTHSIEEAILLGDRVVVMTARPGRLKASFEVPFPRPRSVQLSGEPEFARLRLEIWESLRDEARASLSA